MQSMKKIHVKAKVHPVLLTESASCLYDFNYIAMQSMKKIHVKAKVLLSKSVRAYIIAIETLTFNPWNYIAHHVVSRMSN